MKTFAIIDLVSFLSGIHTIKGQLDSARLKATLEKMGATNFHCYVAIPTTEYGEKLEEILIDYRKEFVVFNRLAKSFQRGNDMLIKTDVSVDIVVAIYELFYRGAKDFIIATSDLEMISLISKLQIQGCTVKVCVPSLQHCKPLIEAADNWYVYKDSNIHPEP